MDPKDKIDLSSLNKTKKQIKLPRPAISFKKKSAGPDRDDYGRFASGALISKPKWMNRRLGSLIVLFVAIVGGYYVFSSIAADGYSFSKSASQLTGGTLGSKTNGTQFRINNTTKSLSVLVTAAEMNNTKQYCADVGVFKDTQVYITVASPPTTAIPLSSLKRSTTTSVVKGKVVEVCASPTLTVASTGGKITIGTADFDSNGNFVADTGTTMSVGRIFGKTATTVQDTTLPNVAITSPTAIAPSTVAQVSGKTVTIAANASDNVGINKVEFKISNTVVHNDTTAPYSYVWDSTTVPNSSNGITVTAYDIAGNIKKQVLGIYVNNSDKVPPQLTVTSPTILEVPDLPSPTAPVSGTAIKLSANATDNIGVAKVEFAILNGPILSTDTSPPYEYLWNSKSVADGLHTISMIAYDAAGSKVSKNIPVRVNNSGKIKIVYAGANFSPSDPVFETWVTNQMNLMLSIKPYDKYKSNISFRSINLGTVPCQSTDITDDGRGWACDTAVVKQKLAAAGVTYNKVLVINNSSAYGGVASNDIATINGLAAYAQAGGVHELSHTFGLTDEYDKGFSYTSATPMPKFMNCYDGRSGNPYFLGITLQQMYPGCNATNWYRSSDTSLMKSLGSTVFSPAALKLMDYSLGLYLR